MNSTLNSFDRREVPRWCCITASGMLETPSHNRIWIPRDASRCLDIFWDGLRCRADYFVWNYGVVFRYRGCSLPLGGQWSEERYVPSADLEVLVVNLAGRRMLFEDLERRVQRPRMEIAAIMAQHGYNGWACAIHQGLKTELLTETPAIA